MRNYAKHYASTIYQDLLTLYLFDLENILSDFEGSLRFVHFGVGGGGGSGVENQEFATDFEVMKNESVDAK